MLIRTKLLLLALIPAPLLLLLAAATVARASGELRAAEQSVRALQLVDLAVTMAKRLEQERDQAAAVASAEARGLEALLLGAPSQRAAASGGPRAPLPPLSAVAAGLAAQPQGGLTAPVREGVATLQARLQELQRAPASSGELSAVIARYATVNQALSVLPDLAGASSGSAELGRHLRAFSGLMRLQDGLALERVYIRHALLTNTLPPELHRELAAVEGAVRAQSALVTQVFGDEATRATLSRALASAASGGRLRALQETAGYAQRQDLLSMLHDALGYGGLHSHYLYFLLRGDERYRAGFHAQAAAAEGVLAQLGAGALLTPEEHADLRRIRDVVGAYRAALPGIDELRRRGLPLAAIEQRLRVDEEPALAALDRLTAFRSGLSPEHWEALSEQLLQALESSRTALRQRIEEQVTAELGLRRRALWATLLGTLLTLALMSALATPLYRRMTEGMRLLVAEFDRLVRTGDVLPRQVVSGRDELSQINQAVVAIGRRLDSVAQTAERMAAGDLVPVPAPLSADDRLAHAMSALSASAREVVAQAEAISAGNYETTVQPRSPQDTLALALAHMARALSRFRDDVRHNQWLGEGQLAVLAAMGRADRLEVLAQRVLDTLSLRCGAPLGVLYLKQPEGLKIVATQATAADLALDLRLAPPEGLVGHALQAQHSVCHSALPAGYLRFKSGLGSADVAAVSLTPLRAGGEPAGVLELGWLAAPAASALALLDAVAEPVGLALAAADARARTDLLLQETQQQAERLREQQDELQQSNEELEQQAQMLRQSEEELKAQREELQTSNEELEQKGSLLQRQREELQRTAHELEQATRYKSEFLANMSHELRTPLNSLLILSKSLMGNQDGNLSADQVRAAQVIHEGGRDLLNLINDILDLSKVEAGRLDIHPQPMRIQALVDSLRRQFEPVATEKRLQLALEIDAAVPAEMVVDRQRLEQILRNLLSNALKFTERGRVRLSIALAPQSESAAPGAEPPLAFAVEDTGIGIPETQLELVFQAFQQADGSTSRRYGGTGLGLTIARQLATLMGGGLRATSTVGQGSRFTLLLPQQAPAATQSAAPLSAPREMMPPMLAMPEEPRALARSVDDDRAALIKGERSILVIEDDPRFAQIVCDAVRERRYKCVIAGDGASALELARRYLPSGIILDLGLPDMDGRRVLDILKRSPATRHIPVHVVSVEDAANETLKQGAIGFLHKPAELADLQRAIDRLEAKLLRGPRSVLVVENDPGSQAAIETLLRNANTRIEMAGSAAAALALLAQGPVDCIVLDLTLPDSDGIELLEQLRRESGHEHPPVVVYTARELSSAEHRRLSELAQSVVLKGARSADRLLDEVLLFLHAVAEELPESQKQAVARVHGGADALQGKKLLLVDDDLRNVFALSRLLRRQGLEVIGADNGQMALERLEEHPDVAVVLMDVMMPVMDGLEAMRRIRAQPRFQKLPVIAVTARAMTEDRRKCMEAGASDYLSKPIEFDALMAMLRIWIASKP